MLQPFFEIDKETIFFLLEDPWRLFITIHFPLNFFKNFHNLIGASEGFFKLIRAVPSMGKLLLFWKLADSIILIWFNLNASLVAVVLASSAAICLSSWFSIMWCSIVFGSILFCFFGFLFTGYKDNLPSYSFCRHFWMDSWDIYCSIQFLVDWLKIEICGWDCVFIFDRYLFSVFEKWVISRRLWLCGGSDEVIDRSAVKHISQVSFHAGILLCRWYNNNGMLLSK